MGLNARPKRKFLSLTAITTASGKLGRAIIKEIITKIGKKNVVGIARTPEKAKGLGIEVRQGNYNNKSEFVSVFQGIDVVLMVSSMDVPDKRIEQHRKVIEGAKQSGVRKIVYTSIYGNDGKCSYTSRNEFTRAYTNLIADDSLNGQIYNLCGEGAFDIPSDFAKACCKKHQSLKQMAIEFKINSSI